MCCTLRVSTWNMRGAMYGTSYFQTILNRSDVCLLTEHWLNESNISFLSTFDQGFEVIYSTSKSNEISSTTRGSGGTAILVRKSLGFTITNLNISSDRICGVKLCSNNFDAICFLCVLLPSTNFSVDVYLKYIDELCTYYDVLSEDYATILGGDCNIDITNSNSCSRKLMSFKDFLSDRNLCPAPLLQGRSGLLYTYRSKDFSKKKPVRLYLFT